ncbi:hypothetical protein EDB86DRAFT_3088394 [Lactarius hatsudake]|nr:hypothetical protein EDB86DRAFT_3088394 [Lactarius hatsudake]
MSHSLEHYISTGGHLNNVLSINPDVRNDDSTFSDDTNHTSDGLAYVCATLTHKLKLYDDNNEHRGKALFAEDLCYWLNTPAPPCDGLSPLHWLGLNPLVKLGAPTYGLVERFEDTTRDLFQTSLDPFHDIDGNVQGGFMTVSDQLSDVNKKLDFLACAILS